MNKSQEQVISRRSFIKGGACALAGGIVLGGTVFPAGAPSSFATAQRRLWSCSMTGRPARSPRIQAEVRQAAHRRALRYHKYLKRRV